MSAVIVLMALLAVWVNLYFVVPVNTLTQTANNFSQGRFSSQFEYTHRNDAVGELAKSIERVGVSTRLALKKLKLFS